MKGNTKLIIGIIIGVIISSGVSVAATAILSSKDVTFTSENNWQVENVSDALDDLYSERVSNNYSTDEKVVGKWVDGKPIYQKTVILNTPIAAWANAWKNNVAFVADNIAILVNAIPYASTAAVGTEYISINTSNGYYNVYHVSGFNVPHRGVTLQYTKTTD